MPAGNISINYAEIERVSKVMDQAVKDIVPMLTNTKASVEGLLDNGLFMQKSSPAMKLSYDKLTTSLTTAITGITTFAGQFEKIKAAVQEMDTSIAKGSGG
ncbi:hypothetical protein [Streptomyces sp. NPDC048057]|uniref:hypothetical protein n=1 Tax=Streptomyces sp. NPDC048057 TaxID=3155628 RepID=UPI0033C71EE8